MHELTVGDRLDQYELTELLARSGMAAVYRAKDTESGDTVALKIPYMQFESDVVFHERFRREEEIGQRLDHPYLIKFFRPREKSRMYIAMEFGKGTSLRALMQKPLPISEALDLACKITEALVYMHEHKVVHRDLKPENVLVDADGGIKLLDFGIALDDASRRLTWAGFSTTVGTPDYMAPEQVSGRRGDVRTDIYAVGTILYEMLTGRLPYTSANAMGMLRAKANEPPEPPSRHVPGIDPKIEDIVLHALEPRPQDRYATAALLLADLRDPSRVVLGERTQSSAVRGLSSLRIPRGVAGTVAVLLIITGLVWLSFATQRQPKPPRQPQPPSGRGAVQ
jgi:serine/threonine-protein kinase